MPERLILVVDDDPDMARCFADALTDDGSRCEIAVTADAALAACQRFKFDAVVSDVVMNGMNGVELMTRVRKMQSDIPVILVTAEGSIGAAVEAVKRGAFQYITKPCDAAELRRVVDQAVASRANHHRAATRGTFTSSSSGAPGGGPTGTEELTGSSDAMKELRARVLLVGAAASPVLVMGETGTGKELVARAIHACSPRSSRPFVTVNAAAIPEALLESEMFGHTRGAFTGATQAHRGMLVEADGGTLLLDEIGDMPFGLQSKLLRVLQTGEIRAVGGDRIQHVDVRVVAATHRKLPELVKQGRFREDLFYRLNVLSVSVPPLRARKADIPELAALFLARARERAPRSRVTSMSPELVRLLSEGSWPGNVRELESAIERLVVLSLTEVLEPRHLALVDDELVRRPSGPPARTAAGESPVLCGIDELVRRHVDAVLAHTDGNRARAAAILGINLSTLYRWQQKWRP
jgi:two-component system response regulator HydG